MSRSQHSRSHQGASTLLTVCRFEFALQLRSPLFWSLCALYFIAHFLTQGTDGITIGELNFLVHINSPFQVMLNEGALAFFGLMPIMMFLVWSISRDYEFRMAEFVFVQPMPPIQFLLGRFLGGLAPALLVMLAGVAGNAVSLLMPWIEPDRLAPYTLLPQVYSYLAITVPYVFIAGVFIFAVTALSRSAALALGVAMIFVALNLVVAVFFGMDAPAWLSLLDPSGRLALLNETRYWSVAELNTRYPVGMLPLNRLLWLGLALAVLALTCWRYRLNIQGAEIPRLPWQRSRESLPPPAPGETSEQIAASYDWRAQLSQLRHQTSLDTAHLFRSPAVYVVMVLIIVATFSEHARFIDAIGMSMYPVTSLITGFFRFGVSPYAVILLVFFSGELVFRERDRGLHEIVSATPYSNWIMPVSKVVALCAMLSSLLFTAMFTSMALQAAAGYTHFQIGLYLQAMFVYNGSYYLMLAIAAVWLQTLAPNKWVGMAVLGVAAVLFTTLPQMGYENVLYLLFQLPFVPHSDIAGFGPVAPLAHALIVYWGFLATVVLILAVMQFPRGYYASWRERWREGRARATRGAVLVSALALIGFTGTGGFIFYNTHVLNEYQTSRHEQRLNAAYELQYGEYQGLPVPQLTQLEMEIDIYPGERRVELRGSGVMQNLSGQAISEFVLSPAPGAQINSLTVSGGAAVISDAALGFYLMRLDTPLQPGETVIGSWDITRHSRGFANSAQDVEVLENGTYLDTRKLLPAPGYRLDRELIGLAQRREYGLGPAQRMPALGDPNYLGVIAAGIGSRALVSTVISTAADQIAVVPGSLVRDWQEGGRRYFEYRTDVPIWPAISVSSGRFEVARDTWNEVDLEIYYDPQHAYNLDSFFTTTKQALDYYSTEFMPYHIPYFRIVEYPRYRSALTAFYGTIPYSEGTGFIAQPASMGNLDYGVLHELAHQWWGHLAISAYMQGSEVLNEALAQYSTFMIYKTHADPGVLRNIQRSTLDGYLNARSREPVQELPVIYVENQGYIAYNKAALNLLYLQELLGSTTLHQALRNYLDRFALQPPPFPTAKDLIDEIRAVAGPDYTNLITDLFEKIVFHEVTLTRAEAVTRNGGYDVIIAFDAHKFETDGLGNDTERELSERFEVVIFPESNLPRFEQTPLYQQYHLIESGQQSLTVHVDVMPSAAGINPFYLMMDRQPGNNVVDVSVSP